MDIYDDSHRQAMFYYCNDNVDDYYHFCSVNNLSVETSMQYYCQHHENEYVDFLLHYGLM